MITITLSNRKGGTGKSLGVYSLSAIYAARGHKVICLDTDQQGSLGSGYFGVAYVESLPKRRTLAALFDPTLAPALKADDIIHPTGVPGIDVVPSNHTLAPYNIPVADGDTKSTYYLAQFLRSLGSRYDYAFIDTPPTLQLSTISAYTASDWVVVILAAEDFASQGVGVVLRAVAAVGASARVAVLGILLNMHDARLALHRAYEEVLRRQYGDLVFTTRVPLAVALKESVGRRQPIALYKPKSAAATAFRELAAEIDARIGGCPQAPRVEVALDGQD